MRLSLAFLPALFLTLHPCLVRADVHLPPIFSDHAVLMRSASVPIWGKADAGEEVTVLLAGKTARVRAAQDGRWMVRLDLLKAGDGPFAMVAKGRNEITISDVLIGRTWMLIGQSNPDLPLKATVDAPAEIARSANPLLREFRIEKKIGDAPRDEGRGRWAVASPGTSGEFSAIGYYFGKKLTSELKQPVGIINGAWGGTFIEAWAGDEAINGDPMLRAGEDVRRKLMAEYGPLKSAYVKDFGAWLKANDREDKPCPDPAAYAGKEISTADWTPVTLPGKIAGPNLPANGAIWIRKEIEVPAAVQDLIIKATLGPATAFVEVYWNGERIYEMPYQKIPGEAYRHYFAIPQADVRPGKATFAVRLYAPLLRPALLIDPEHFTIGPISLKGEWLAKAEYSLPELSPSIAASAPRPPRQAPSLKASAIFNGVVHPIIPYALDGILWYQGESNDRTAYDYRKVFPLFISDLRAKWNQPNLPFYFCQLPNFQAKATAPGESAWAELRESQSLALKLPNTAQAVLIDLGEADDIHPRDKLDAGNRLARIALARQYGRGDLVDSGPVYESMTREGSKVRVKFTHLGGGLVAKPLPKTYDVKTLMNRTAPLLPNSPGSELEGFAICGEDRHWVWAQAKIDADSVLVWSDKVPSPIAVRYAWASNPTCNLYNAGGLPASPFRTDDFPVTTEKTHFGLSPSARY